MSTAPQRASSALFLVVGANGGGGASLVAGALALAWARRASGVWLVELDLGRGDRGDAWGLSHERTLADLAGVVGEIDADHLRNAACGREAGLQVLLAPATPGSSAAWDPEAVERLLTAARAASGDGGRVVVDGGVGLSGASLAAAAHADGILIVCSPTVAATRRARRLVEALATSGADARCGLVVNGGPADGEIGARSVGRAVGAPILAALPWVPRDGCRLAAGRWPAGRRPRLAVAIEALAGAVG